ncbi:AzlC family ABC transporter permease [Alkaliphilus hydrothermalis]|uniref:4-azaleucine resistance transporter AzlC n=1 Tax=Alkaliphilus hydrothermalis TaxID=1482730 RepID=A0ABS2NRZ4_9FIRM|nr:AzlC family ABC transporter permease [Alkaliphilus hydrothermalis]MBM7615734.1 4-azaleucine resistance transporter AzlC [Alkaliphilus hydrothermalis]
MKKKIDQEENQIIIKNVREGIIAGIPILVGYIPVAMAFGMLAKTVGTTFAESLLFSILVFAGASQFMALNLLAVGVGIGEIILATLLMNFRHFLMSGSLAARLKKGERALIPLLAFGVTDETFSVTMLKKGEVEASYVLPLQLISYISWVGGTGLGYLLGEVIPPILRNSMGIALYGMFMAILIPAMKASKTVTILALGAGAVNTLITYSKILPSGWSLIVTILVVSAAGVYLFPEEEETKDE